MEKPEDNAFQMKTDRLPNETTLFLSPHLDDAVLSCPGRILTEVARGRRAVVATLFTEADNRQDQRIEYQRRREEDRRAVEALGAEVRWLGLPDAPFRRRFYSSFRTIVLETHPEDEGYRSEVGTAIRRVHDEMRPARVYAPLGVGTHIDHRLTYSAVAQLVAAGEIDAGTVSYYEDRPYALVRHHVRMRLSELGIRSHAPPPADLGPLEPDALAASFLASFDAAHYVRAHLPPGAERESCRRRLVERLRCSPPPTRVRSPDLLTLARGEFDRCLEAARAYGSQIGAFFGSLEGFARGARETTRWMHEDAFYAERAWRE